MGYYCISNAIIEGCENRIFQVCNRQLCYFFSIQSYGRAYPTPRGALPNMWGTYKRKTLVESKGVDRHVRLLPHAAWNAACSNHFLWRVEYALEGSQFFYFCHLSLYSLKSWSCCFMHTFLLIFCGFCSWPAGFDLWCDWAFSLTSFETYSAFFFVAAKQPFNRGSRLLRRGF